jgi:hypothetical protein
LALDGDNHVPITQPCATENAGGLQISNDDTIRIVSRKASAQVEVAATPLPVPLVAFVVSFALAVASAAIAADRGVIVGAIAAAQFPITKFTLAPFIEVALFINIFATGIDAVCRATLRRVGRIAAGFPISSVAADIAVCLAAPCLPLLAGATVGSVSTGIPPRAAWDRIVRALIATTTRVLAASAASTWRTLRGVLRRRSATRRCLLRNRQRWNRQGC